MPNRNIRPLVSRQRSWQVFKTSKGLCRIDGKHPTFRNAMCVEHYVRDYYCKRYGLPRDPKTVQTVCRAVVNAARYGYRKGLREGKEAA